MASGYTEEFSEALDFLVLLLEILEPSRKVSAFVEVYGDLLSLYICAPVFQWPARSG